MKQWYYVLFLLPMHSLGACPTCMGRLSTNAPTPFFSDEHYKTHTQVPPLTQAEVDTEITENVQTQERPETEDLLP